MWEFKYKPGWDDFFQNIRKEDFFIELMTNLDVEYNSFEIYPPKEDVFKIFNLVDPEDISVIIIGQDPYHRKGLANGIAFSCNNDQRIPASLRNIFKELESDLEVNHFDNLNLENWVEQGVFLINAVMTVREGKPASHKDLGWDNFIEKTFDFIYSKNKELIFCLWGNFAKRIYNKIRYKFKEYIEPIYSAHPSPFSYHLFKNSKPFSKINDKLIELGKKTIDWDR